MIIFLNKKRQRIHLFYVNNGHEAKGFLSKKKLQVQLRRAVVSSRAELPGAELPGVRGSLEG